MDPAAVAEDASGYVVTKPGEVWLAIEHHRHHLSPTGVRLGSEVEEATLEIGGDSPSQTPA